MPETSLLQRLRERKLVQWAFAYLAGAFVVFQAVEVMAEPWGISPALQRAVHIVLLVGLFITLVLAWYHGEKGRQRVSGPELLMVAGILVVAGVALSMLGSREVPAASPARQRALATGEGRPRVAVLLCANLSPDPEDEYLAASLHDEILLKLQKVSTLFSIGRTSVLQYAEAPPPTDEIASDLGVGFVGECSVQKQGNRIRLIFQLLDGSTGEQIWAENYDRGYSTENLFDIQSDIAQQVAEAVGARLTADDEARIEQVPTEDLSAYEYYLLGKDVAARRYAEGWDVAERGIEFYERAIQADSGFVRAYASMASAYASYHYWGPGGRDERENAYRLARSAAEKALALDSLSAEAHMAWGSVLLNADHDLKGAEAEFRRALELNPGCFDAIDWMDELLRAAGRYEEAVEFGNRALELDPKNPVIHSNLASSLWGVGRLEEAAAEFGLVTSMGTHLEFVARYFTDEPEGWVAATPSWFTEMFVYEDMGWGYDQAFAALMENLAAAGASPAELRAYRDRWGGLDWSSLWEADLDRSRPGSRAGYRARAYARLGQREQAVAELRRAWEEGEPGMLWIHGNPFFRNLEGFGPYEELMEELGLRPGG